MRSSRISLRLVHAAVLVVLVARGSVSGSPAGPLFVRGDFDGDGVVLINDPIALLSHQFSMGPPPGCEDAADANDDGGLTIADAIFMLSYLFSSGPQFPEPFPGCGTDWTDDVLACFDSTPACTPPQHSFVLNTPSDIGGGDDFIQSVERLHDGTTTIEALFDAAPPYDELRFVEVYFFFGFDLLAVQSTGSSERIIHVEGATGTVIDEFAGHPGSIEAMEIAEIYVYLVTTEITPPKTRIIRLEPFDAWAQTVLWEADEVYDVRGVTVDYLENVYLSGSNTTESGIFRVDSTGTGSLWVSDPDPGPLQFDIFWGAIWMVSTPAASPAQVKGLFMDGSLLFEAPIEGFLEPEVGDIALQDEFLLIPYPDEDFVMAFNTFSTTPEIYLDASDGLEHPVDVTALQSFAIP